jgi:hypothetical protein
LALPSETRTVLVQFLTSDVPRPNGSDPDPPPVRANGGDPPPVREAPARRPGKPTPDEVAAAEDRLLAALRSNPGASLAQLAKLTGAPNASASERLRRLAARGLAEKVDDHWALTDEPGPRPISPPSP